MNSRYQILMLTCILFGLATAQPTIWKFTSTDQSGYTTTEYHCFANDGSNVIQGTKGSAYYFEGTGTVADGATVTWYKVSISLPLKSYYQFINHSFFFLTFSLAKLKELQLFLTTQLIPAI
jgi:hypothetical protein